jgi:3-methyladenine DNA glycosylase AlkD
MGLKNQFDEIMKEIKQRANGPVSQSLVSFGLNYGINYGVSIPELQLIAEKYKTNHDLAQLLFHQNIRECKILASIIADPEKVTGEQIDNWSQSFSNLEIVEQVCSNLLWRTDCALSRSIEWCLGDDELLQRAGLIIAARSATNPDIKDIVFEPYIEIIDNYTETHTSRNKGSIEFALRQIAKRNSYFKDKVIKLAQSMADSEDEHRAWIGGQILFNFENDSEIS